MFRFQHLKPWRMEELDGTRRKRRKASIVSSVHCAYIITDVNTMGKKTSAYHAALDFT